MTTTSWHSAALHDLENTSMTRAEIGKKYNRSPETIKKLQERSKIVRKNPPLHRGPARRDNKLPLSRQHHAIGIRLNMVRGAEGSKSFADKLGVSSLVLAQMEVGQHDFKLSQLLAISEATNLSIPQLMASFETNLYQPGRPNVRS